MKNIFVIALVTIFLSAAPYGIAINYQTKECARYWEGDEFVTYTLPSDWKSYYPDDNGLIKTEIGTCDLNGDPNWAEDCCKYLGLPYISDSIGEERGQRIVHPENFPATENHVNYFLVAVNAGGVILEIVLIVGLYRAVKSK